MRSPRLRSGQALRVLPLLALAATVASADVSGKKWAATPVTYHLAASINNTGGTALTGTEAVPYSTVLTAMQRAFSNWTTTKVAACTTTWTSTNGALYATPSGTAALNVNDNLNNVIWLGGATAPNNWTHSSATLGLTTVAWDPADPGTIVDADMELNNNTAWSDQCPGGQPLSYDYESVVLHEAGHFLGLNHTTSSIAVMYASVFNNTCKRVLATPDTTDVCAVYPGSAGSQGIACSTDANCTSPLVCRSAVGSTAKICTATCTSASCPTGYTCQSAAQGLMACLPQTAAPDLCKFCTSGPDCSGGQCVSDNYGHLWCTSSCTTAAQCGSGYQCVATYNVCQPTTHCTNQCAGSGQSTCAVGYTCVSGNCEPTANPGDHCELTAYCNACGICIGTNAEAYCRTCCGGTTDCTGCPNAACATGGTCTQVSGGSTDKVCIPSAGLGLCSGACTVSPNNCLNGASCIAGRCHTLCNPQTPGACVACLDRGGTNGVCACADETSGAGQVCGESGGALFACQTGLACVGTPLTCRRPCTIGASGTCATGEVCTTVSSRAVCMPDAAGQQCAACAGTTPPCGSGLTCLAGRCYLGCNTNTPSTCSNAPASCAQQLGDGSGVCACPDQLVGMDQACQGNPIAACQANLKCIAGFCRGQCNVLDPNACGIGLECKALLVNGNAVGVYCQVFDPGTGGGGGGSSAGGGEGSGGSFGTGGGSGSGGNSGTGGTGGGTVTSQGCGCGAGTGELAIWPALALVALGLRRRPAWAQGL